jgi:hypothetical protein
VNHEANVLGYQYQGIYFAHGSSERIEITKSPKGVRDIKKLRLVSVSVLAATATYAQDAYIELLRSDVKTQKVAIITEVMQFTEVIYPMK